MTFVTRPNLPTPLTGREAIDRWMESNFGYPWSSLWNQGSGTATPVHSFAVDIYENTDSYVVLATLPGVNPDDVEITALKGTLTIAAELKPSIGDGNTPIYREMSFGQFRREVRLPGDFDLERAEATYNGGLLTLTLPKAEHLKPKSLKIKTTA
ncbi:MAG TPA: Hsp20/alpha crystallin family protein [Chloroflexota bacterium]|nr:Hsp20/alpha crystallin family protein [Chloroflexota bacterium]